MEPFDIKRLHREIAIILHREEIYINDAIIILGGDQYDLAVEILMKYDKRTN